MSVRQVKSFIIDLLYWCLGKLRVFKTYFLHVPRYLKPIPNKIEGEILIIVPHADDELIGCHQFIRHNINNATLFYCGFTGKNKTQENHIVRLDEFKKYCEQSNCKYVVSSENVKEDLYSYLDEAKPDIVAIPSIVDWHSEHRVINYYIRDYINSHRNPCIKSVLWYHLSVPLYAGNANYACLMDKKMHLGKWNTFKGIYHSQMNIDIKRFMLAERDCIDNAYAAETFLVMDVNEFQRKVRELAKKEQDLNALKPLLQNYNALVMRSSEFYRQAK